MGEIKNPIKCGITTDDNKNVRVYTHISQKINVLKIPANVIKIREELTMKIWGNIPKVSGVYGNTGKFDKPVKVGEASSKKDELSISGTAKDFGIAMKKLRQIPDVRQDKINEIIQKMDCGNYSVKASDVAEKIVTSFNGSKI